MRRYDSKLQDKRMWKKFQRWVQKNLDDPDIFDKISWDDEVDKSLSFDEAARQIRKKLQGIWQEDHQERRLKKIVFIKPLIEKLVEGEICVSFRKSPKLGLYYVVENRFQKIQRPKIIVEFYRSEKVDPYELRDEDAMMAGIRSVDELLKLFKKWYGDPIPKLFRNWLRVVEASRP